MKSQHTRLVAAARIAVAVLVAAAIGFPTLAAKIKRADWVAAYEATAMGTGHVGAAAGRAARVNIDIYRWTTPDERQKILDLIATGDGKKIRAGLDDLEDIGRIRFPGESGYELVYAWQVEENGKKMVVAAMNRPLASLPGATMGASIDYLVGVAVLDPADGTGIIAPAVELEIQPDGKINVAESAADPVKLSNIKLEGK